MNDLSHFDEHGASRMVDVGYKALTQRIARASAVVRMKPETVERIKRRDMQKGDVLEVARLAGIMAAKRTSSLIPLCHPLPIESIEISYDFPEDDCVEIQSTVRLTGKTGVEMEALVATSNAALTIYDMCKSIDRGMTVEMIRLEEKSGGKSGHFIREDAASEPNS